MSRRQMLMNTNKFLEGVIFQISLAHTVAWGDVDDGYLAAAATICDYTVISS